MSKQLFLNNQKGSIVLITILILSIVIVMVLGSADLVKQGIRANRNQEYSATAYFAAETGAERTLWENRKNGFEFAGCVPYSTDPLNASCVVFSTSTQAFCLPCTDNLTRYHLDGAFYQVRYNDEDPSSDFVWLLAIGEFRDIVRSIEVSYRY